MVSGLVGFSRSYLAIALRANMCSTLALAPCPKCYSLSSMGACMWACMFVEGPRSLVHRLLIIKSRSLALCLFVFVSCQFIACFEFLLWYLPQLSYPCSSLVVRC